MLMNETKKLTEDQEDKNVFPSSASSSYSTCDDRFTAEERWKEI